ncbi:HIG1 domain family member 1A, mitochondrial-like [Stylophora pistillata]|uniref:HIG1 domain family member 1C n=1 Tax=Stylophora pistillata TaxID=50429 RepID=A0A2B4SGA8_STYPI|nr:HIG1 domain family member 1A, mitochondrial-like [Stylophora pistillata]PFX27485.1 HIG1 domain family member 1C [Stylophora pistillata]
MSRSDAQKLSAEFMTDAEKETETDRLVRKSKQQPFIPIGIAGTVAACVWGAIAYKNRGPAMTTSRYLMRLRVIAQSCVVGSIIAGIGVTALQEKLEAKAAEKKE